MEVSGTAGQATTGEGRHAHAARWPLAAVALLAVLLATFQALARDRDLDRLRERARSLGLEVASGGTLDRALTREADPGERRLVLAHAALAAALAEPPGANASELADRFAAVRELARDALALLPASAEAPRLLGVTTALERLARRDTALVTGIADWERPLEVARRRSPAGGAADRALAAAYLEIWPALTGQRRERAGAALAAAFAEPPFFARALPRWLELAGSIDAAAELLPDAPTTWEALGRVALRRGDLAEAAKLRVRWRRSVAADATARLADAEAQARTPRGAHAARRAIDDLLAAARPDGALVPIVDRALAERPAGPPSPALAAAASRWIAWALPLCLTLDCPLSPASFDRLGGSGSPGLAPEEAAFATLAAGDRGRAERFARRTDLLWRESWAPYLMLSARAKLAAGDRAGARGDLDLVHRSARRDLPWRLLERAAAPPTPSLAATAATAWQPTEWRWQVKGGQLLLDAARSGEALRLNLAAATRVPTLLELEWDGRATPPIVVPAGATAVRWPGTVAPGPHVVRFETLAGDLPAVAVTVLE